MGATSADVYISYAGNDAGDVYTNSRDEIVKKICEQLEQRSITVKEYKTALQYKDNLKEYMLDISYAKIIVVLVSDKYLKSEYCMYEAIEILNHNKKDLYEKIFPVVLNDADIFDIDKRMDYVLYWDALNKQLDEKLKGRDPKLFMSLFEKGKLYREITENMDEFLDRLSQLRQLPKASISQSNYQEIIDAILKQLEETHGLETSLPVQVSAAEQNVTTPVLYSQVLTNDNAQNVASLTKSANDFMSLVINKVNDTILDSENAKKDYININFDELSGEGKIQPATLNFIYNLRTDKNKYEPYRQSLIISALSLGLIKKYDETKARLLIDFATDDDPVLSYRALTGVVLGLLDKEDFISDDIKRKLETLQDNVKIQRCLLIIFFLLGNKEQLQSVTTSLQNIDYTKFEFFEKTQHWFQPFYEGNTMLKENVPDKKFAKGLLESVVFLGLDSTKYALTLLYSTLTKENIDEFKKFCELDKSVIDTIKTENLQKKFLLELEVSKYVLEFYIYASVHNDASLIALIEDDAELRAGYLYKLVLNDVYQKLLQSNLLFFKKEYVEAANTIKPALEDQPNNIEVLLLYGVAGYYAGNYEEVIPVFEKVLSKGIKEVQVLACLGDAYFNTKQFDKAIEAYEELLTLQSNIPAVVNIGRSYQLKQEPDHVKALEYYLKANELEPDNYTTLLLTGDAYINQTPQDFAKAFEYYEKAYRMDNSNLDLVRMLTNCTIKLPGIAFEKCFEIYTKHIELEPDNALPYMAMGDRYFNKEDKDFSSAFDYYEKAFGLADTNLVLIKTMSDCLQNLPASPFEKSQKLYLKWIELEPGNVYPYLALGDAYINKSGDYTNAFKYYNDAYEIQPTTVIIESLLGTASQMENPDMEKVEALYAKYKELEPLSAKPGIAMAAFYLNKSQPDYSQAETYYSQAYGIAPNDKDLLYLLGKYYQLIPQPDYERSYGYLHELLKQEPDDFYPNFYLGWGNFVQGNYADAKLYFEKCLLSGNDAHIIYQNLGHIALIQHDEASAKILYKKSCDLFTDKEEFFNSSLSDLAYLEKGGISKDEFERVLKEVVPAKD